jgi:dolichyl-phosphate beta-glucosyltransferase
MASLAVVIPAYNEEQRILPTLERLVAWSAAQTAVGGALQSRGIHDVSIVVVDDGSRDRTAEVVRRFAEQHGQLQLLSNPGNRGKGYAVRNGMLHTKADWLLISDADLSAPIEELSSLLDAVKKQSAEVAIGSRSLDRSLVSKHQSFLREMSGRTFNVVMRIVTGLPFRDTQCGFKLFSAKAASTIFPKQVQDGFSFDVEILVIAKQKGLRSIEVPVRWANVEGTKVSIWNGLRSFLDLLTIRGNQWKGLYD